jgi:hypothetical protein
VVRSDLHAAFSKQMRVFKSFYSSINLCFKKTKITLFYCRGYFSIRINLSFKLMCNIFSHTWRFSDIFISKPIYRTDSDYQGRAQEFSWLLSIRNFLLLFFLPCFIIVSSDPHFTHTHTKIKFMLHKIDLLQNRDTRIHLDDMLQEHFLQGSVGLHFLKQRADPLSA